MQNKDGGQIVLGQNACFVCKGSGGSLSKDYRNQKVHHECWNAIRSHNRIAMKDEQMKKRLHSEFLTEPERWRQRIVPLVSHPGEKRSAVARQAIRDSIEAQYKKNELVSTNSLMTLSQFIVHKKFWEGLRERDAKCAFEEEYDQQVTNGEDLCDSDGEPVVRVKMPRQEVTTKGTMTSSETRTSSRSAASSGSRDKRPAPPPPSDEDDDDDHEQIEQPPRIEPAAKRFRTPTKSPSITTAILQRKAMEDMASPGSAKGPGGSSAGEVRQVQLLQARSEFAKHAKQVLEEVSAPKGAYGMLKKKVDDLGEERRKLLQIDPAEKLKVIEETVMDPLKELVKEAGKVALSQVAAKKAVERSGTPIRLQATAWPPRGGPDLVCI